MYSTSRSGPLGEGVGLVRRICQHFVEARIAYGHHIVAGGCCVRRRPLAWAMLWTEISHVRRLFQWIG